MIFTVELVKDGVSSPLEIDDKITCEQFREIVSKKAGIDLTRLEIRPLLADKNKKAKPVPRKGEPLKSAVGDVKKFRVKDLGPQIGWRTVFLIEYFGPILVHISVYLYAFGSSGWGYSPTILQQATLAMVVLHFLKREYESAFVHRFSGQTMPLFNLFKNSAHYWLLSGLLMAAEVYSPWSRVSARVVESGRELPVWRPAIGLVLYVVGEVCNLIAHINLRNLRPEGLTERRVPKGFPLFDRVTSPNYMFEIIAWIGMCLVSRSYGCAVFLFVAAFQMALWARAKENRYIDEFGKAYPRKRWVLFYGLV